MEGLTAVPLRTRLPTQAEVPTWLDSELEGNEEESGIMRRLFLQPGMQYFNCLFWTKAFIQHPKTIDATRLKDGKMVFIKRIDKGSSETDISLLLSLPQLRKDPKNHAVPVLELITGDEHFDFLVLPLLRRFDRPPFINVEEVVDFIQQTLEVRRLWIYCLYVLTFAVKGLAFLHKRGIAHRLVMK